MFGEVCYAEREMKDERYKDWLEHFTESDQQSFKESVKQWLRSRKEEIKNYGLATGAITSQDVAPYAMLAQLLNVSLSSINNWMSLKGRKPIPEDRVNDIKRLMDEVALRKVIDVAPQATSGVDGDACELSDEQLIATFKCRLSDAAIGKFYREAEESNMSLDVYLRSLLK